MSWASEDLQRLADTSPGAYRVLLVDLARVGDLDSVLAAVEIAGRLNLKHDEDVSCVRSGSVSATINATGNLGALCAEAIKASSASLGEKCLAARRMMATLLGDGGDDAAAAFVQHLIAEGPDESPALLVSALETTDAKWIARHARGNDRGSGDEPSWMASAARGGKTGVIAWLLENGGRQGLPKRKDYLDLVAWDELSPVGLFAEIGHRVPPQHIPAVLKTAGPTDSDAFMVLRVLLERMRDHVLSREGTGVEWDAGKSAVVACLDAGARNYIVESCELGGKGRAKPTALREVIKDAAICLMEDVISAFQWPRASRLMHSGPDRGMNLFMLALSGLEGRAYDAAFDDRMTEDEREARHAAFTERNVRDAAGTVKALVAHGFDIEAPVHADELGVSDGRDGGCPNKDLVAAGATVLQAACFRWELDFARALVDLGADPLRKNAKGKNAIQLVGDSSRGEFKAYCDAIAARRAVAGALESASRSAKAAA